MSKGAEVLIEKLARKDADILEKFVLRVLDIGLKYWSDRANKAMAESTTLGSDRDADEPEKHYNHSFRQWHGLQQMRNNVKTWLDTRRLLPEQQEKDE